MSPESVKIIAFIVLLIHGIGHFQGVVGSLGMKLSKSYTPVSWFMKGLSENVNRTICFVLFLITGIVGIAAALSLVSLLIPNSIWQVIALITAFSSTITFIFFPNGLAMFFNKAGAIAVNLIIFYSILFNGQWPASLFND